MADKDDNETGPSLELPSLGFGFGRRKKQVGPESEPGAPAAVEPVDESSAEAPVSEDPLTSPSYGQPTEVIPPAPELEPETAFEEPTRVIPEPVAEEPAYTQPVPAAAAPAPEMPPKAPRAKRATPLLSGMSAVAVTGLLVGLLTVGVSYLALAGCELVRGTSSCGGPGLFLLLAILLLLIAVGARLLRLWNVKDSGTTAFLGVGLVAVLALVFFVDQLTSVWMLLVIPALSVVTFALSAWITSTFVEEEA